MALFCCNKHFFLNFLSLIEKPLWFIFHPLAYKKNPSIFKSSNYFIFKFWISQLLLHYIANSAEPDPYLGSDLKLSRGGSYPCKFALRFAAGFGSQIALALYGKS